MENNEDFSKDTEKKKSLFSSIMEWVIPLGLAVLAALAINHFLLLNSTIESPSMESTLMTGTHVMGSRLSYLFGSPDRGDIIFFKSPYNEDEIYIKRVIGLPGETVHIRNNEIYINDNFDCLEEPYVQGVTLDISLEPETYGEKSKYTDMVIPDGCYLVMGDNREISLDSRSWGYVKEEDIYARAFVLFWPFSDFKFLDTPEYSIDSKN